MLKRQAHPPCAFETHHRVIATRVDLGLTALEFTVDVVYVFHSVAVANLDGAFASLLELLVANVPDLTCASAHALISLRVDGRTKQSVLEAPVELHSHAYIESFLKLTEAMFVKLLAMDKLLPLDRKCNLNAVVEAIMETVSTKNMLQPHCQRLLRFEHISQYAPLSMGCPSASSRRTRTQMARHITFLENRFRQIIFQLSLDTVFLLDDLTRMADRGDECGVLAACRER